AGPDPTMMTSRTAPSDSVVATGCIGTVIMNSLQVVRGRVAGACDEAGSGVLNRSYVPDVPDGDRGCWAAPGAVAAAPGSQGSGVDPRAYAVWSADRDRPGEDVLASGVDDPGRHGGALLDHQHRRLVLPRGVRDQELGGRIRSEVVCVDAADGLRCGPLSDAGDVPG